MNKTYNCPICGTEGFGSERIPACGDRNWEWWSCAGCDDHLPVTPDEEE